ncbi:hypothetical protein PIB30_105278 [Stylosanthes scabra]|uniref:Aminotransferase-like plant mobile domain-containing protein n=1 Tax=Stylosanthes scabra TaxID=79078 RepID=A0ABU6T029_9FABA|nr:hypothetical protein [Stylosanthes scabra]
MSIMDDILVPTAPRQAGVPAGVVRYGDINRKNANGWHIATTLESPRILHARRNSHVMAPPKVLMPYFRDNGFGRAMMLTDFHFDLTLLSAFVEWWRSEMHSFHISWVEVTITLQDVAYHLRLRRGSGSVETTHMGEAELVHLIHRPDLSELFVIASASVPALLTSPQQLHYSPPSAYASLFSITLAPLAGCSSTSAAYPTSISAPTSSIQTGPTPDFWYERALTAAS